ncbi:hypothetical protein ACFL4G_04655 [Thermodesulfobacteriota bacterium]
MTIGRTKTKQYRPAIAGIACLFFLLAAMKDETKRAEWAQKHITDVPVIMMRDPLLELLGQTADPVPYTYEEAVKLAGHSCGAVAGAWIITRKALEVLYPGEVPVRGQIAIEAPGAKGEWIVGVFGEIMTYITGAAPRTGFHGSSFGKRYNRRDLLVYRDAPANTPPTEMAWIFKRIDTDARVSVRYDLSMIQPTATPDRTRTGIKMVKGEAAPGEAKEWIEYWNARVAFIFENADSLKGFFTVTDLGPPPGPGNPR